MAESADRRYLTFRVDARLYALPAEEIAEVIRMPMVARVPQSPKGLLGLANLRGAVLPLASVRGLLGRAEVDGAATARAIVLQGAAPVILAVDAVEALVAIAADRLETRQAELAAEPGETLRGAFRVSAEAEVAKVLDIKALLARSFAPRQRPQAARSRAAAGAVDLAAEARDNRQILVTFEVAAQEYALPLADVQEIIFAPQSVAKAPQVEALVLGVGTLRDTLLPLLSLRGLLGFNSAAPTGQEKVVVVSMAGMLIGLVADRMRSILRAEPASIDPTPPVLAARAGGETRIKAIYRADGGSRLVSILDPTQLFREDVMQRLAAKPATPSPGVDTSVPREEIQVLVFQLGGEEFGLPIAAVEEVARAPDKITRVPKAPRFLEGVINLRGEVLPVVDQRRRFDMPKHAGVDARRLVVVRTDRHKAGLVVDSVSEVLRAPAAAIEPAPDLTGEAERVVDGVLNLEAQGRLILMLDPAELLSRTERKLLAAFEEMPAAKAIS